MPIALRLRFGQRQDLFRWAWLPCLLHLVPRPDRKNGWALPGSGLRTKNGDEPTGETCHALSRDFSALQSDMSASSKGLL